MLSFIEGFEAFSLGKQASQYMFKKYPIAVMNSSNFVAGRVTGIALSMNGTNFTTPFLGNSDSWVIGFAFKNVSYTSSTALPILELKNGGTVIATLKFAGSTGLLTIDYGPSGTATGTAVLQTGFWYYLEWKYYINSTTGFTELRVNQTADITQNNVNTGSGVANAYNFRGTSGGSRYLLDDMYINNATANPPVSQDYVYLGDVVVEGIYATGVGNSTQWSRFGAATNWQAVQEDNGDNSYVTASLDMKDTYQFGDLFTILPSSNVLGIAVTISARRTLSDPQALIPVVRTATADYDIGPGSMDIPDTAYYYLNRVSEVNPNTSTYWTYTQVNGAEFGFRHVAPGIPI